MGRPWDRAYGRAHGQSHGRARGWAHRHAHSQAHGWAPTVTGTPVCCEQSGLQQEAKGPCGPHPASPSPDGRLRRPAAPADTGGLGQHVTVWSFPEIILEKPNVRFIKRICVYAGSQAVPRRFCKMTTPLPHGVSTPALWVQGPLLPDASRDSP